MCRSKGTHLVSSADSTTSSSARSPRHLFCRRKAAFAHCGHESLCFRVLFFLAMGMHLTSTQTGIPSWLMPLETAPIYDGWGAASLPPPWPTRRRVVLCISEFPGGIELWLSPMESGFITHTSVPRLASTLPPGVACHRILVARPVCFEGNLNQITEGNYWHTRPEGPEGEQASGVP